MCIHRERNICIYIYIYIFMCCVCVGVCVCMYIYTYIYMYEYMIHAYMCVYIYIYMYLSLFICICILAIDEESNQRSYEKICHTAENAQHTCSFSRCWWQCHCSPSSGYLDKLGSDQAQPIEAQSWCNEWYHMFLERFHRPYVPV